MDGQQQRDAREERCAQIDQPRSPCIGPIDPHSREKKQRIAKAHPALVRAASPSTISGKRPCTCCWDALEAIGLDTRTPNQKSVRSTEGDSGDIQTRP